MQCSLPKYFLFSLDSYWSKGTTSTSNSSLLLVYSIKKILNISSNCHSFCYYNLILAYSSLAHKINFLLTKFKDFCVPEY